MNLINKIAEMEVLIETSLEQVRVRYKNKNGHNVTIIEGVDKAVAKEVLKTLKRSLGCGGTFKDGVIELQGTFDEEKVKSIIKTLI